MNAPERLFVPGVYRDLPFAEYLAIEAMSSSGAKKMLRSQRHYLLERTQHRAPTDSMEFGTAVHFAVLQPDLFPTEVLCAPELNLRTNAGKEEWAAFCAAHVGKTIIKKEAYDRALRCRDEVYKHPAASRLLDGGEREVSLLWNDGKYGVPCKCRFDTINLGGAVDLKTTTDASPEGFARAVGAFHYEMQAAHYFSGAEHALNETPRFWTWIAVESEEPHAVGVYACPSNGLLAGAHRMAIVLERYRQARETGVYQGYPDTIEVLHLPRYITNIYH